MSAPVLTVKEFCTEYRRSPASFWRDVAKGELKPVKAGRRTLIARAEAERWFKSLPTVTSYGVAA